MPIDESSADQHPCPFILKGTLIEKGEGKAIVMAVGQSTQFGKTEKMLMGE